MDTIEIHSSIWRRPGGSSADAWAFLHIITLNLVVVKLAQVCRPRMSDVLTFVFLNFLESLLLFFKFPTSCRLTPPISISLLVAGLFMALET